MNPLDYKSSNCVFNSFNSADAILYGGIEIDEVLGTKSIENSISRTSGNPVSPWERHRCTHKQSVGTQSKVGQSHWRTN